VAVFIISWNLVELIANILCWIVLWLLILDCFVHLLSTGGL
jgi:hypothetical protein